MSDRSGGSGEGPFREHYDSKTELAKILERMRKQIEAEGKYAIQVPENIGSNNKISAYQEALEDGQSPENIVLYSKKDGLLRYLDEETARLSPIFGTKKHFFYYSSESSNVTISIRTEMDYSDAIIDYLETSRKP